MPLTFDRETRTISATVPDREGQGAEFRWRRKGNEKWNNVPYNGTVSAEWLVGDDKFTAEVQARLAYANGGFGQWASFCDELEVTRWEPAIYGVLVGECPPGDRGDEGSIWITPGGDVWRRTAGVWARTIPADVGPDGVHGVLWRATGLTLSTTGDPVTRYRLTVPDAHRPISDNLVITAGSRVEFLDLRPAQDMSLRIGPGPKDLIDALENDIAFALRDAEGNVFIGVKTNKDDVDDPYGWFKGEGTQATLARALAFIARAGAAPFDMLLYRVSAVCADDPLSPWVEDDSLAASGGVVETIYAVKPNENALPDADIPPASTAYNRSLSSTGADVGFLQGATRWYAHERQTSATNPWLVVMSRQLTAAQRDADNPNVPFIGPLFRKLYAADGRSGLPGVDGKRPQVLYAATIGATAPTAKPPATLTFSTYTNSVWHKTLEAAGYGSNDKYYGWRVERLVDAKLADSAAITAAWGPVDLFAHYGLDGVDGGDGEPGQEGRLAVFGYNSAVGGVVPGTNQRVVPTAKGQYTFVTKNGQSVNNWGEAKAAKALEIHTLDKRGLPALTLQDIDEHDWIVFEVGSRQWISFDIDGEPSKIGEYYHIPVAMAKFDEKDRPSFGVGDDVRWLFSEPRRQKPVTLYHTLWSKMSRANLSSFSGSLSNNDGLYRFSDGTRAVSGGPGKFPDIVNAHSVQFGFDDALGQDMIYLFERIEDQESVVVMELNDRQWVAWRITSSGDVSAPMSSRVDGVEFTLLPVAYDVRGGLDAPPNWNSSRTSTVRDVTFRFTERPYTGQELGGGSLTIADSTGDVDGRTFQGNSSSSTDVAVTATLTLKAISSKRKVRFLAEVDNTDVATVGPSPYAVRKYVTNAPDIAANGTTSNAGFTVRFKSITSGTASVGIRVTAFIEGPTINVTERVKMTIRA